MTMPSSLWVAIVLVFGLGNVAQAQIPTEEGAPLIQIRIAHENPTPGSVLMDSPYVEKQVYVSDSIVLSDEHITDVLVRLGPESGILLTLKLTEEGSRRLREATGSNVGGFAVLLLDAHLVQVARIATQVGHLDQFTTGATDLERTVAARIAAKIRAQWQGEKP